MDFQKTWWPTDEDRLRRYRTGELLFEGDHVEAFKERSAKLPDHLKDRAYISLDYPKLISTTFADLLFGEPPVITLPGQQDQVDKLIQDNNLFTTLYESELTCSFAGDAVFRISLEDHPTGRRVRIKERPPWTYFVEHDPDDHREVLSQCLAWERTVELPSGKKQRYLRVERHTPGQIQHELYRIEGLTRVKESVDLSVLYGDKAPDPIEKTGVPYSLVFHVPNARHGGRYWGMSDYTPGLITLFDELNQRWTSLSSILDKHADPKLVVPPGTLSKHKGTAAKDLQVMEEVPDSPNAPRYLGFEPRLDACFQEIAEGEEQIFIQSDVSAAMFGRDKAGSIESGRAMLMRFARTLTRVARKAMYRQPVIQQMIFVAMLYGAKWCKWEQPKGLVEVLWRNGLPRDHKELTESAVALVTARILSRVSAYRYVFKSGQDEAEAEQERVKAEDLAQAPDPTIEESSGPSGPEIDQEDPAGDGPPEPTEEA